VVVVEREQDRELLPLAAHKVAAEAKRIDQIQKLATRRLRGWTPRCGGGRAEGRGNL
jgi:hypothetical protein